MANVRLVCHLLVTLGVFTSRIIANFEHQFENKQDVDESLIARMEKNINTFLDQGFKNAEKILQAENKEILSREDSKSRNLMFFHSRKTNEFSHRHSFCKGLGMLETSKLIAKHFNIPKSKIYETLERISIPSTFCKDLDDKCTSDNDIDTRSRCDPYYPYRRIDGRCNNLRRTHEGAANTPQKRYLKPDYEDGTCNPRGHGLTGPDALPNPRTLGIDIRKAFGKQEPSTVMTQMVKAWGQFVDHDIVITPESTRGSWGSTDTVSCCENGNFTETISRDCLPIDVTEDPFYSSRGVQCLRFVRSLAATGSRCRLGVREQMNQITSYIDASNVYGSDHKLASKLRAFVGGKLKTNEKGELGSCPNLPQACPLSFLPETQDGFIAGDSRVNVQPGLISMHSIFVRYHNKIATLFSQLYPSWKDEKIYQETRKILGALMQHITYSEFLPVVLGKSLMEKFDIIPIGQFFNGYNSHIRASIANVFAAAAFRFGHSLIGDNFEGKDGNQFSLMFNFFNSEVTKNSTYYPSHLIQGECTLPSEEVDPRLVISVVNYLGAEGPEFSHGSDLMALNIMRGRDHGLPSYNSWREFCGLKKFNSFDDLKSEINEDIVKVFEDKYQNVDEIDLYPAGLAENKAPNSIVGPTFACIIGKQFRELKFGDRFWYENSMKYTGFTKEQLQVIKSVNLATIICETTSIEAIQNDVMLAPGDDKIKCSQLKKNSIANDEVLKLWQSNNNGPGERPPPPPGPGGPPPPRPGGPRPTSEHGRPPPPSGGGGHRHPHS